MDKYKKLSLALLTAFLLSAVIAYALIQRQVQHSLVIVASENFNIYENAECTIPLNSIDWGTTGRNIVLHRDYYIKSLAEVNLNVWWSVSGLPSGVSLTMTFNSFEWSQGAGRSLPVGAVYAVQWDLTLGASAEFGSFSFSQVFNGQGV